MIYIKKNEFSYKLNKYRTNIIGEKKSLINLKNEELNKHKKKIMKLGEKFS